MSDWIIGIVKQMGYIGIAFLTSLENVFPPIPSELIMPLAGFVSEQGGLNIFGAIAAGSVGSLAGAFGWYYIGRLVGEMRLRNWVDRHGKWLTLSCEDLDRSKDWFSRHGAAVDLRTASAIQFLAAGVVMAPFALLFVSREVAWSREFAFALGAGSVWPGG